MLNSAPEESRSSFRSRRFFEVAPTGFILGERAIAQGTVGRAKPTEPFAKPGTAIVGELLYLPGGVRPLDEARTGRRNRLGGLGEIPSHWTGGMMSSLRSGQGVHRRRRRRPAHRSRMQFSLRPHTWRIPRQLLR